MSTIPNSDRELQSHLKQTAIGLLLFFGILGAVGYLYEPQLEAACRWIFDRFGIFGLNLFIFVNDALISPIPPDLALIVFSKSERASEWLIWVTIFGFSSSLAGLVGWSLGRLLQGSRLPHYVFGKRLEEGERLMKKYGAWAVGLGAVTPIPFSLTTWSAGVLKVPFRAIIIPCLLRVPRFLVYYLLAVAALKL
jgi:membrane protein YqaA with SNARE-associated domain